MKHLPITTALLALTPTWAMAATVYPGCAVPTMPAKHNTFFVDPAKGSNKGDGSAAKPWRVLSEVLFNGTKLVATPKNPNGPIKPGDVIMLKNGDHGTVAFTGFFNSDFVTVMAAPGQTPLIRSLSIVSSGKWMFQGLKFMPGVTAPLRGGIVAIGYGDWQGTTKDIVIDNSTVSTVDSTSSWSSADWTSKAQGAGIFARQNGSCVSITNNHIFNVTNGIGLSSDHSVVQGNTIDTFFNDGIDITAGDLLIKQNTIRTEINNTSNSYHADGIQGWSAKVNNVIQQNNNVTLDGNTIIKAGNKTGSYMQGISIFDGKWQNLTVQNNLVVVNHWNAITVMGIQNSRIINNTVVAADPVNYKSLIMVRPGKDGTPANNVTIRNNIATGLSLDGSNITADHNIAATTIGLTGRQITSGTIGTLNKIVPTITEGFASFDLKTLASANFRLKPSSPAVGFGVTNAAPAQDLSGKTRKAPIDAGAYTN